MMKHFQYLLILLLSVFLYSCTDTREELNIKNNGSGTLAIKSDLGKMIEIMKSFASDSDIRKEGLDKAYDTTMLLKSYLDTAKDIPADKKDLFKDGKIHLNLNVKESIGKFDILLPFSSPQQLQKLYENLNSSTGGLKGLLGGIGNNQQAPQSGGNNDPQIPQIGSVYDIVVKDGLYSRKVNKERYDKFSQNIKLEDLQKAGGMLGSMSYTITVTLERPIKKISNSKATLNADKKTATLVTDLLEAFAHPELMELEIEY